MIKLKDLLTENVNTSDLKYQMKMSLDDSGIGAKALIGMKPKGADYFLKMKSYMYQDSMNKVLKHVNSVLKSKLKVKNFKKTRMGTEFVLGESVNEDIVRGNEVHAKTKKELKAAIAKSMKEILAGKTPKYDIINGMSGEMIGWKDGNDYIWQPHAIQSALRELK